MRRLCNLSVRHFFSEIFLFAVCMTALLFTFMVLQPKASAQGEPPPDPHGQAAPRVLEQDSVPPAYFLEVRDALKTALSHNGQSLDVGQQSFNFVVVYNAATPISAGYDKERDVIAGLLRHYLVPGDYISLVPYQLKVRTANAVWNRPITKESAAELFKTLPDKPEEEPGFEGGHSLDAALLETLKQTPPERLNNTIILALTDGTFLDTPKTPLHYVMPNADKAMAEAGFVKVDENSKHWNYTGGAPGAQFSALYRIYLPQHLQALSPMTLSPNDAPPSPGTARMTTREANVAALWGKPVVPEVTNKPEVKQKNADTPIVKKDPPPAPPADYTAAYVIGGGVLLLAVIGGYMAWLFRPRTLRVGINSIANVVVTFNKPVILGASEDSKKNIFKLDGLPEGTAASEKVARLEVTPLGAVQLRGERWKTDRNGPVNIQPGTPPIRLSRDAGGQGAASGLLASGDAIMLIATLVKGS